MALSVEEYIEVTTKDGRRLSGIVQSADVQQIVLTPVR
jgi:small nuclear ribonucleoprotein (snRNP)-like protein